VTDGIDSAEIRIGEPLIDDGDVAPGRPSISVNERPRSSGDRSTSK
jgi:hypothetical protein